MLEDIGGAWLAPLVAAATIACGGAASEQRPATTSGSTLHEGFRRIQLHEAAITRRADRLARARLTRQQTCAEVTALCADARELCSVADTLDDADAAERCSRALSLCANFGRSASRTHRCGGRPVQWPRGAS
ncbi:MAG: hypothetical protein MJD61_01030 [Proteobacteria bacterium]|nr:hypothetical protein [Pseudomonadota bacterium]